MLAGILLAVITLGGCATAPAPVVVPREVLIPVATVPTVTVPAEPVEEPLTSREPAAVVRTAEIRIEQWRAYARQLELLLAPFAIKPPAAPVTSPTTPAKP